jgi:hypothetical protein
MRWGRILVAGIGTQAAVLLVITLAVTAYAFTLAFEVRGAPDQARIGQFAAYLGHSFSWVLRILLALPAAAWAVRKVHRSPQLHGALIGLVVAATGLVFGFAMSLRTIAEFTLTVGAGWLGGALVERHRMKQDRGHAMTR